MQPMDFPVMPFVPLHEYDPFVDEYDDDDWHDWDL